MKPMLTEGSTMKMHMSLEDMMLSSLVIPNKLTAKAPLNMTRKDEKRRTPR